MVKKHTSNKYVSLEDVRVSYSHKDDTIHITSGDPDVQSGGFHLTLNKDTQTETVLRNILIENDIISSNIQTSFPDLGSGSKIISIASPKGGSGKTSLTYSLASSLIKEGLKVAVVDSDFRDGQVGIILEQTKPTILGFVNDYKKSSHVDLKNYMVTSDKGWDALLAPIRPYTAEFITTEIIDTIFTQLRDNYDVVLVDTSVQPISEVDKFLFTISDYIFCVVRNDLTSVTSFIRWVSAVGEFIEPAELARKTGLILNFLFKEEDAKVWERFPEYKVLGSIPYSKDFQLSLRSKDSLNVFLDKPSVYTRRVKDFAKMIKSSVL